MCTKYVAGKFFPLKCIYFFFNILVPEGSTTPTKSLKSRMMEKFGYGKSPGATSSPIPIGNFKFQLEKKSTQCIGYF